MAKYKTHLAEIRAQVKANHNGEVPKELDGTCRDFAAAKELRDVYRDTVMKMPTIVETGSTGQKAMKQNPLCNLLYQQEGLCQTYAKMLGLTAAKAASKPEDSASKNATNSLDEYIDGIKG